jgi:putative phage-type endonuclease
MNISAMMPARALPVAAPVDAAWLQSRIGKLTGSRMAIAMSFLRDGKTESAERRKLKMELVAERLTDICVPHYVSSSMAWGIATEAEAKEAASRIIGVEITPCGFFDHPSIDAFGATPDGLIDDDGCFEVKCPETVTHLSWLLENKVPDQHRAQMTAQLVCTGRRYCQFLSYDPRVPKRPILYKRFAPSQQERDKVEAAARVFLDEVDQLFEQVANTRPRG